VFEIEVFVDEVEGPPVDILIDDVTFLSGSICILVVRDKFLCGEVALFSASILIVSCSQFSELVVGVVTDGDHFELARCFFEPEHDPQPVVIAKVRASAVDVKDQDVRVFVCELSEVFLETVV
jgi:hypothetical protein